MVRDVMDYKIIAFVQIYNEISKGNLERFVSHIKPIVDDIYFYDDASTDGSYEYLLSRFDGSRIIRGTKNDFQNEIGHKQILLQKVKQKNPDFILWLDVDEVLSGSRDSLIEVCNDCLAGGYDGVALHELNLYRSYSYIRKDSLFDLGWFTRIWRCNDDLQYFYNSGLHNDMVPFGINSVMRTTKLKVIHYGFSDIKNLSSKYWTYRKNGQRGYNMLDRLIWSKDLVVEKLSNYIFPSNELVESTNTPPLNLSFSEAISEMWREKERVVKPKFSIICLIYKSVDWLKFVYSQVIKYTNMDDKEFIFIVNDGNESVKNYLKNNFIRHYIFNNTEDQRNEWYINNVYRAYNYGAQVSNGDFVVFINSDMAFTNNWFENLWASYDGKSCISSRLVESGKLRSGLYGIEKNFGSSPSNYMEVSFNEYARNIEEGVTRDGGLYMPLLIRKSHFIDVGMYPEGNIKANSQDIFNPIIASQGDELIPGDKILMQKLKSIGVEHKTAFNSIVYHFQCGEMDDQTNDLCSDKSTIAVCNDLISGVNGERTFFGNILSNFPNSVGIDSTYLNCKLEDFSSVARLYFEKNKNVMSEIDIVFQNSTFIDRLDRDRITIMYVQDNLRRIQMLSDIRYPKDIIAQQEKNMRDADILVTNSIELICDYDDFDFEYLSPIGSNSELFKPLNKKSELRDKYKIPQQRQVGIFVGDMSEVKGWGEMISIIDNPKIKELFWIVVSKKKEDTVKNRENVKLFNCVSQNTLCELHNCADFFILPSKQETQCLAAIEALLCDIPIIIYMTGFTFLLDKNSIDQIGIINKNFDSGLLDSVIRFTKGDRLYNPRLTALKNKLSIKDNMDQLNKIFCHAKLLSEIKKTNFQKSVIQKSVICDAHKLKEEIVSIKKSIKEALELGSEIQKNTLKFGNIVEKHVNRKTNSLNRLKKNFKKELNKLFYKNRG